MGINVCRVEEIWLDRSLILRSGRGYWRLRRCQDVLLSLAALVVLFPFMLIIALLIMLDDPSAGPIFVQDRIGRDGTVFRLYKFRTMYAGAENDLAALLHKNEMDGPVFKMMNDPRITRIGKILRRVSIDEFPQLINVLKGDMSVVGPRPALPREYAQYTEYQKQRLYVQPGLTCYWQIQPQRNNLSFDQWLYLDLKYIRERSFVIDWKIIFSTFRALFWAQGV